MPHILGLTYTNSGFFGLFQKDKPGKACCQELLAKMLFLSLKQANSPAK